MMDIFRVRLNCIDHYQTPPTRYDPQLRKDLRQCQDGKGPKVPVIRIFGSTETGQKVCAHIHGAFPYLYVEYTGSLDKDEGKNSYDPAGAGASLLVIADFISWCLYIPPPFVHRPCSRRELPA